LEHRVAEVRTAYAPEVTCIDQLSDYLDNENLSLVVYAARILTLVAPYAGSAVPRLEHNLRRLEMIESELLVSPAQPLAMDIYDALEAIEFAKSNHEGRN